MSAPLAPEYKDGFRGFGDDTDELHVVISPDNQKARFAGFLHRVEDDGEPKPGIKAMLQRRGFVGGYGMVLLSIVLVLLVLSIVGFLAMITVGIQAANSKHDKSTSGDIAARSLLDHSVTPVSTTATLSFGNVSTTATPSFGNVSTTATPSFGNVSTTAAPSFGNMTSTADGGLSVASVPTSGASAPLANSTCTDESTVMSTSFDTVFATLSTTTSTVVPVTTSDEFTSTDTATVASTTSTVSHSDGVTASSSDSSMFAVSTAAGASGSSSSDEFTSTETVTVVGTTSATSVTNGVTSSSPDSSTSAISTAGTASGPASTCDGSPTVFVTVTVVPATETSLTWQSQPQFTVLTSTVTISSVATVSESVASGAIGFSSSAPSGDVSTIVTTVSITSTQSLPVSTQSPTTPASEISTMVTTVSLTATESVPAGVTSSETASRRMSTATGADISTIRTTVSLTATESLTASMVASETTSVHVSTTTESVVTSLLTTVSSTGIQHATVTTVEVSTISITVTPGDSPTSSQSSAMTPYTIQSANATVNGTLLVTVTQISATTVSVGGGSISQQDLSSVSDTLTPVGQASSSALGWNSTMTVVVGQTASGGSNGTWGSSGFPRPTSTSSVPISAGSKAEDGVGVLHFIPVLAVALLFI